MRARLVLPSLLVALGALAAWPAAAADLPRRGVERPHVRAQVHARGVRTHDVRRVVRREGVRRGEIVVVERARPRMVFVEAPSSGTTVVEWPMSSTFDDTPRVLPAWGGYAYIAHEPGGYAPHRSQRWAHDEW